MSPDLTPEDPTNNENPGAEPAANADHAVSPANVSRNMGLALMTLLLAMPIVYLVWHSASRPKAVNAQQPSPTQAAATNIAEMEAAVRASPTSGNRVNLALSYINSGAAGRAIPVLQSVVGQDKSNVVAWNDLCVAHTLQQDYATAIDECNQALTINPSFQLARNNLKWAAGERDKVLATLKAEDQSTTMRDASFLLKHGLEQLHVGDYDQAIISWQQVLQLDPKSAMAANNIGIADMMRKHPDEAVAWFNRALALDPDLQIAKNNLAWANEVLAAPKP